MRTVLKLGGSVVTEKDRPETVDEEALARAADAIDGALGSPTASPERNGLVVVHGGGSFGHHHADRHGVSTTEGTRDAAAIVDIHAAMGELNDSVVATLQARGVGGLPVRPLSLASRGGERSLTLPTGSVETMLDEGFVPVLHGDVVVETGKGGTILSGDELVVSLARSLDADRVGVCSTVPGVCDADGAVIERIDSLAEVADALGTSEATDVTGGMAGKVRALLSLGTPAHVFGLDDLPAFLAGESPGTLVGGGP